MSISIVLAAYAYDRLMSTWPWRWSALWIAVAILILTLFLVSNDPMAFIINHLTMDPQTGHFRLLIWNAALAKISDAPLTGFAFDTLDSEFLDHTVDSVSLVFMLRFGIPMIVLLLLTNLAAFLPTRRSIQKLTCASYIDQMRPAFTMVLAMFMFIGLTVHFWNYTWIFWSLCIGIRSSLRERSNEAAGSLSFKTLTRGDSNSGPRSQRRAVLRA